MTRVMGSTKISRPESPITYHSRSKNVTGPTKASSRCLELSFPSGEKRCHWLLGFIMIIINFAQIHGIFIHPFAPIHARCVYSYRREQSQQRYNQALTEGDVRHAMAWRQQNDRTSPMQVGCDWTIDGVEYSHSERMVASLDPFSFLTTTPPALGR